MDKEEYKQHFGRLIESNEIIFDFDNRELGFEAINFTGVNLYNVGYKFEIWYAEGQKSPHLHIRNILYLDSLTPEQLKRYKELFLLKYSPKEYRKFLDLKLTGKHRIAEENKPHYKYYTIKKILNIWNEDRENFAEPELIEKAKQVQAYSSQALPIVQNVKISLMEKNCLWLNNTIQRTDLNHSERSAFLFLYMKLGEQGEARLKEIMKRQENYSEAKTNYIIDYYKRQNKFYGISCKKLIEKGICNFSLCPIFQKEKKKFEIKNG